MFTRFKEIGFALVVGAWGALLPIHALLYWVFLLIGIDLVVGVYTAFKLKEAITSRRLRESVGKTAVYLLAIIAGFAADNIVGSGGALLARAVAVGLMVIEIKSLDESLRKLDINVLGAVLDKLKPPPKAPPAAPPAPTEDPK